MSPSWRAAEADLPGRPRRVLVAGTSGSGKTTLARTIAAQLGTDVFEIDALYHGPGWIPQPAFVETVCARIAQPSWVTEWQYSSVKSRLADRADLLVWLDLPKRVVMTAVTRRTIRRSLFREELWNGNREPALRTILTDRDHIIRWAWRTHPLMPEQVMACLDARPQLTAVRLRSRAEVAAWVEGPLTRVARQ